jgi:hypothetical protein
MVIVDYVVGLVVVLSTVIDPKPVRVRRHKPVPLVEGYQFSVERDAFRRGFAGPDDHSWKGNARHAHKNWMRHPNRITNTGGARVLRDRCYFTL